MNKKKQENNDAQKQIFLQFQMTDKATQRRRGKDPKNTKADQINEKNISTIIKRKQSAHNSSYSKSLSKGFRYVLLLSLCLIGLIILYKIFMGYVFVENTNVPINLPKLVNADEKAPDRFWGTYR